MDVRLDAMVADIIWLVNADICFSDQRMNHVENEYRTQLILEWLRSKGMISDTGKEHCFRAAMSINEGIRNHGIEDEVVAVTRPLVSNLLVEEYTRLLGAFGDDRCSVIVDVVISMYLMHRDGLVENCGRTANGDRDWRSTEKAMQLGFDHGLDVPVGPFRLGRNGHDAIELHDTIAAYIGFLAERLLESGDDPSLERDDSDEACGFFTSQLVRFLVQSGLAEVLLSLSGGDRVFVVGTKKLHRKSSWILTDRKFRDERFHSRLVRDAARFLAREDVHSPGPIH